MDVVDPSTLRAEHDHLLSRLSTRRSVEHFARAAVSAFAGVVLIAAAMAHHWDRRLEAPTWATAAGVVSLGLGLTAAFFALKGRSAWRVERQEFSRLSALRRALGVDAPPVPSAR